MESSILFKYHKDQSVLINSLLRFVNDHFSSLDEKLNYINAKYLKCIRHIEELQNYDRGNFCESEERGYWQLQINVYLYAMQQLKEGTNV